MPKECAEDTCKMLIVNASDFSSTSHLSISVMETVGGGLIYKFACDVGPEKTTRRISNIEATGLHGVDSEPHRS